jgi:hypothetical protein
MDGGLSPKALQAFWQDVWQELGFGFVIPPPTALTARQRRLVMEARLVTLYLPPLSEDVLPPSFVPVNWDRHLCSRKIERLPLTGQWVAIESISKSAHDDPHGYVGTSRLDYAHPRRRFETAWSTIMDEIAPSIACSGGFAKKRVRVPSAEEWNCIANLFSWLRVHRQMDLPQLGVTRSWEWCRNRFVTDNRLVIGFSECGGISSVTSVWRGGGYTTVGYRLLIEV